MSFSQNFPDGGRIEGDFSGIEKMLAGLKEDHHVDIGILGSGERGENGESVAEYGAKHEFGSVSEKVPERSFILMPLTEKQGDIEKAAGEVFETRVAEGDIKGIFRVIGTAGEAAIQEAFATGGFGKWKPLAQSTIEEKGSSSILIDTGALRKSITSRVK